MPIISVPTLSEVSDGAPRPMVTTEATPFGDLSVGLIGANSLEGSLADHFAARAAALLRMGQNGEAASALAEARRIQFGLLVGPTTTVGDRMGLATPEPNQALR